MSRHCERILGIVLVATLFLSTEALANGRYYTGGHPYHNGFPFVPPSSAYESVRVRPPFWYGAPAYYYPQSYLGGSVPNVYGPTTYQYQYAPTWRQAGYYMSAHGAAYAYPW